MARRLLFALLFLAVAPRCQAQQVRVGVLSRFHPHRLELTAPRAEALVVRAGDSSVVLEPGASANLRIAAGELVIESRGAVLHSREVHAAGRLGAADFLLAVPGNAGRRYRGSLSIRVENGELAATVSMDLETAVASVVQAESAPETPLEALKALAVAARSYYVAAKARHEDGGFCDLTHCQVLRGVPGRGSTAARAAEETRGLVLAYDGKPFAAMFTRSCGGHTRTPAENGMPANGYPYFPVICVYCHTSPYVWTRKVSREDAELLRARGEAGRLAVDRRLGWNAVPSNDFTARDDGAEVRLEGKGSGHGIGLCQRGAAAMAAGGAGFRQILTRYFPNTGVISLNSAPGR